MTYNVLYDITTKPVIIYVTSGDTFTLVTLYELLELTCYKTLKHEHKYLYTVFNN